MKKIAVVTGTRAEYGILLPVIKAIKTCKDLELLLVVTGAHLSRKFGYTVSEIGKDGLNIDARVKMLAEEDTLASMSAAIGQGITAMTRTWEQLKPDIILVLGDRIEPLAAAISGAYMNIPIAHIHGGDSSRGGLDESARHAITKFSHIHFPATPLSAERIKKMGEDTWRVHMVGSPALDAILHEKLVPPEIITKKFGLEKSKPFILLVQHSVTTEVAQASMQITETLEALAALKYPVVTIYPNSDAGGQCIIKLIRQYEKKYPIFKVIPNLPRRDYLSLLNASSVLIGNSSSGMIDSPSFGVPVVNIGTRQEGRERGNNVIDTGHNRHDIIIAVKKALTDKVFLKIVKKCENPYGDGQASKRIADILSKIEMTPQLLQKKITY